ncbi:YceI family protein [Hyphomonas sp. WL0036]|uniref:YceI family protein n=1 Tax=Hyphomonas sediminis TaxID=2866160 RepID=UPI001C80D7BA|nr:YceI family protein [Hyphomonas sediminis]MBY9068110.1 YceI family protein [Hyphomonas sediminis]
MNFPFRSLAASIAVLATACATAAAPASKPTPEPVPAPVSTSSEPILADPTSVNGAKAGTYKLDKHHASIVFSVDHLGFSHYVGQFTRFDATLTIDPETPETAHIIATIDPTSLIVPTPPEGFLAELLGPNWLNAEAFSEITFESSAVTLTSSTTAQVTGNLTFLGAVQPISFAATFNGGYAGFDPFDPNSRAGFAAEGSFSRSAFGMVYGLPPEGTKMGVGDGVNFRVDAEFTGPPL